MTENNRLPTLYIPHGGGPCFFIKPEDMPPGMPSGVWDSMADYLIGIDAMVGRRPKAVLVITAHWLTPRPTFSVIQKPDLYYDYYNFPDYTYQLKYPVAGAPEVAARARALLADAGIASDSDDTRGIDHGVFIPFLLIYPDADVPIVAMSLQQDMNAAEHLAIGQALAPLRDENVLIVGSGMSFHNMRAMMTGTRDPASEQFAAWLTDAATAPPAQRNAALAAWEQATGARASHPVQAQEHLIPLMVAAGAADSDVGKESFSDQLGGNRLSGYTFG